MSYNLLVFLSSIDMTFPPNHSNLQVCQVRGLGRGFKEMVKKRKVEFDAGYPGPIITKYYLFIWNNSLHWCIYDSLCLPLELKARFPNSFHIFHFFLTFSKQIVYYDFNTPMTMKLLREIITKIEEVGGKVRDGFRNKKK